ncbi:hypothetical protein E2C01_012260 [Portunus trituberculatus]|uniref:Uncharacterized protein n=1 Tax=Portunus trituberculatus TaxID=210409 RepID=A0A5B7DDP5_PORTR|nr:hypothetical protein [Portunus trituberculatus]
MRVGGDLYTVSLVGSSAKQAVPHSCPPLAPHNDNKKREGGLCVKPSAPRRHVRQRTCFARLVFPSRFDRSGNFISRADKNKRTQENMGSCKKSSGLHVEFPLGLYFSSDISTLIEVHATNLISQARVGYT